MGREIEQTVSARDVCSAADAVDTYANPTGHPPDVVLGIGDCPCGGRFAIRRLLGQGGMGQVFLAWDAERDELVALKTLQKGGTDAIARIKWEFRSLADVSHPNVARLHELFEDNGQWFFTMEYVGGVPLLGLELTALVAAEATEASQRVGGTLRQAFRQVADGIAAIHAAGKLHRDLKPSNVLVDDQGRVVILDFGLVATVRDGAVSDTGPVISGTPAYLSPEQAGGKPATTASDWYSFGVMLYEALSGQLPFDGTVSEVLAEKQRWPSPPRWPEGTQGRDEELETLAMALLTRDPIGRAGLDEVRRVLGTSSSPNGAVSASVRPPFVGRAEEVETLLAFLDAVRSGPPQVVLMPGPSGIGKSTLMAEFCARARRERGALVLASRCYERENVPFNALDAGIQELIDYLTELDAEELQDLLPQGMQHLVRLFPEFDRVTSAPAGRGDLLEFGADPHEERRKAFVALAGLLRALARARPLVLALDDLQWMDLDSVRLLMGILAVPGAPPFLLVAAARPEGMHGERPLGMLIRNLSGADVPLRIVEVAPLNDDDSIALVNHALPEPPSEVARGIVREAKGSPFYTLQLTYYHGAGTFRPELGVDGMLRTQVDALPVEARVFLQAAALSPAPTPRSILLKVADHGRNGTDPTAELRHERLIRIVKSGGNPSIVPYHDRVREALLSGLSDQDQRRLHRNLAEAWLGEARFEPEVILTHLHGAGEDRAAVPYALRAAEQAESGLAFDRAAELYEMILRLLGPAPPERAQLLIKMAQALAHAGHGPRAAAAFLEAASLLDGPSRLDLRWSAVEQLLQSRSETTTLLLDVLSELKQPVPGPRARTSLLLRRGLRDALFGAPPFVARPESAWDREAMRQFDHFVTAGWGLVFGGDLDLCVYLLSQCVTLGRRSGEPGRMGCALAIYLGSIVQVKGASLEHVTARSEEVLALAEQSEDSKVSAVAQLLLGQTLYQAGSPRRALQLFVQASDKLRAISPRGLQMAESAGMSCLFMHLLLGDLHSCRPLAAQAVELGEARSQPFFRRTGYFTLATLALAADDLPLADEHHRRIVGREGDLPDSWFKVSALQLQAYLDVAHGTPDAHLAQFDEGGKHVRSMVERHHYRPWLLLGHAVALIACAQRGAGRQRKEHLRQALLITRELESKNGVRVLRPYGRALRAAIHGLSGQPGRAANLLNEAEMGFTDHGMMAYRNMVRRARGQLLGGSAGAELVQAADDALRSEGVRNPERLTAIHFPGLT